MSAFAALFRRRPLPAGAISTIGDALGAVTARPTSSLEVGPCAFLFSPLHENDPAAPVTHGRNIAVGTVVIEGRTDLAERLTLDSSAHPLQIVAAARERWGDDATRRLSGEYAMAGWDGTRDTFWCARDGLGIRLLYVAECADAVVVSNVLDAILGSGLVPAALDETAIVQFLAHGYPVDPVRTPYRAIGVLPEGHTLEIGAANVPLMRRHWLMPAPEVDRRASAGEMCERYRDALRCAVRDRLASTRTTIFLSGGMDSTTIATAARDAGGQHNCRGLTIRLERFAQRLSATETRLASRAAVHLGLPLDTVRGDRHRILDGRDGRAIPSLLLDEPTFADWQDVLAAAAAHSTVALNGEDGDALFAAPGGRDLLRNHGAVGTLAATFRYLLAYRARPYLGVRTGRATTEAAAPDWLTAPARQRLEAAGRQTILGCAATPLPSHATRPQTQARLSGDTIRAFGASVSPENTRQRVEVRLPLMDRRVIECVFSAPPIPWCQHKALARAAFSRDLPAEILRRRKTPLWGYYEEAVQAWRRDGGGREPPAAQGNAWIDDSAWLETARYGAPLAVVEAWRAIQVGAWLSHRAWRATACTT